MSITQNFCALLLHRIGTWTLESPWLCTTWPSSMRMAAVGKVFLSTPRGKFYFAHHGYGGRSIQYDDVSLSIYTDTYQKNHICISRSTQELA